MFLATLQPGGSGSLTLYQKNLRFDNAELPALEADIRQTDAVALTLQEVSDANRALLAALATAFPISMSAPSIRSERSPWPPA